MKYRCTKCGETYTVVRQRAIRDGDKNCWGEKMPIGDAQRLEKLGCLETES